MLLEKSLNMDVSARHIPPSAEKFVEIQDTRKKVKKMFWDGQAVFMNKVLIAPNFDGYVSSNWHKHIYENVGAGKYS